MHNMLVFLYGNQNKEKPSENIKLTFSFPRTTSHPFGKGPMLCKLKLKFPNNIVHLHSVNELLRNEKSLLFTYSACLTFQKMCDITKQFWKPVLCDVIKGTCTFRRLVTTNPVSSFFRFKAVRNSNKVSVVEGNCKEGAGCAEVYERVLNNIIFIVIDTYTGVMLCYWSLG